MKNLVLCTLLGSFGAVAAQPCLFGDTALSPGDNPRLIVKSSIIKSFKMSRISNIQPRLMLMNIDLIIDRKTGRQFHQNTTFRHQDDGDNTIGWIEEIAGAADSDGGVDNEGQVVAEIGDSEIYNCIVKP